MLLPNNCANEPPFRLYPYYKTRNHFHRLASVDDSQYIGKQ